MNKLDALLEQCERVILRSALADHGCNKTRAGASLGLSLRQMRYRMEKVGMAIVVAPDGQRMTVIEPISRHLKKAGNFGQK